MVGRAKLQCDLYRHKRRNKLELVKPVTVANEINSLQKHTTWTHGLMSYDRIDIACYKMRYTNQFILH